MEHTCRAVRCRWVACFKRWDFPDCPLPLNLNAPVFSYAQYHRVSGLSESDGGRRRVAFHSITQELHKDLDQSWSTERLYLFAHHLNRSLLRRMKETHISLQNACKTTYLLHQASVLTDSCHVKDQPNTVWRAHSGLTKWSPVGDYRSKHWRRWQMSENMGCTEKPRASFCENTVLKRDVLHLSLQQQNVTVKQKENRRQFLFCFYFFFSCFSVLANLQKAFWQLGTTRCVHLVRSLI